MEERISEQVEKQKIAVTEKEGLEDMIDTLELEKRDLTKKNNNLIAQIKEKVNQINNRDTKIQEKNNQIKDLEKENGTGNTCNTFRTLMKGYESGRRCSTPKSDKFNRAYDIKLPYHKKFSVPDKTPQKIPVAKD